MCFCHPSARERTTGPAFVNNVASNSVFDRLHASAGNDPMATTLTLNAKYPDWTQDDWDRFHWINSTTAQFSAFIAMQTMWDGGHLRGEPRRHAVSQRVHPWLPEVPSVLRDHHRPEPGSVLLGIRQPEMHFLGRTKSRATANGTTMELYSILR
jgi:hypothetical protein